MLFSNTRYYSSQGGEPNISWLTSRRNIQPSPVAWFLACSILPDLFRFCSATLASVGVWAEYLSVYLSIYLSIYLLVSIVCLSIYFYLSSIYLSIYLFIYLYISICLSIYLYLSINLSISIYPSMYLWLYTSCGPWPLFQYLNLYTVGGTPWTGNQPVAKPLPTHTTTQTQNKRRHPRL
jgi:hypothetical protein